MVNFVLVHGAWLGAWSWEKVIGYLEKAKDSHDVGEILAPDLPGHGQHFASEIRRITMDQYVHAVTTLVQVPRLENLVLVGHGFAGTFLPQVALQLGDIVRHVVFIGSELPPEGKSAYERLSKWDKGMLRAFKAEEKGFKFPDFIFSRIICNGLDKDTTERILSRLVPEPFLPWQTAVSRQGFDGRFPTTYVVLKKDKAIRARLQRRYAQSLGSAHLEELDASHGALLSHPEEVAAILLKHL